MQLKVQDLAREDALYHISPIKAVHAVCAHRTGLSLQNLARLAIDEVSCSKAYLKLSVKVPIPKHLVLDDGDELGQVFPLHLLALSMEVEPNIV